MVRAGCGEGPRGQHAATWKAAPRGRDAASVARPPGYQACTGSRRIGSSPSRRVLSRTARAWVPGVVRGSVGPRDAPSGVTGLACSLGARGAISVSSAGLRPTEPPAGFLYARPGVSPAPPPGSWLPLPVKGDRTAGASLLVPHVAADRGGVAAERGRVLRGRARVAAESGCEAPRCACGGCDGGRAAPRSDATYDVRSARRGDARRTRQGPPSRRPHRPRPRRARGGAAGRAPGRATTPAW